VLTQEQYTTAVFTATRANAALTLTLRTKEALGCYPDWNTATCQGLKIKSGLWSLSVGDYTSTASVDIYNQLLDIGSTWFGGITFDPNAQNPGGIEVINVPDMPEPLVVGWADFSDTGDARFVYDNPDLLGWNPFMALTSPGLTGLELGTDYVLISTGGFELLPGGNVPGIFEGQIITIYSYAYVLA